MLARWLRDGEVLHLFAEYTKLYTSESRESMWALNGPRAQVIEAGHDTMKMMRLSIYTRRGGVRFVSVCDL